MPACCLSKDLQTKLESQLHQSKTSSSRTSESTNVGSNGAGQESSEQEVPNPSKSRRARRKKNAAKNAAITQDRYIPGFTSRPQSDENESSEATQSIPDDDVVGLNYTLRAVVLHHGNSAHSGHYTCLARRRATTSRPVEWMHIDDKSISAVSERYVYETMKSQVSPLLYVSNW